MWAVLTILGTWTVTPGLFTGTWTMKQTFPGTCRQCCFQRPQASAVHRHLKPVLLTSTYVWICCCVQGRPHPTKPVLFTGTWHMNPLCAGKITWLTKPALFTGTWLCSQAHDIMNPLLSTAKTTRFSKPALFTGAWHTNWLLCTGKITWGMEPALFTGTWHMNWLLFAGKTMWPMKPALFTSTWSITRDPSTALPGTPQATCWRQVPTTKPLSWYASMLMYSAPKVRVAAVCRSSSVLTE